MGMTQNSSDSLGLNSEPKVFPGEFYNLRLIRRKMISGDTISRLLTALFYKKKKVCSAFQAEPTDSL